MMLIEGEIDNRPVRPFIERCVLTKQENALLRSANVKVVLENQRLWDQLENSIENTTLEFVATKLSEWYPDNANTNAFCAAIRSLIK